MQTKVATFAPMNERVDIQFKGLTTSPSDYACGDGELAVCHNLVNEGGDLHAMNAPDLSVLSQTLGGRYKLLGVHRTSEFTHYIVYGMGKLGWTDGQSDIEALPGETRQPEETVAIGNILVILLDGSVHYSRWNGDKYESLSEGIPDLPTMSFGLMSRQVIPDSIAVDVNVYYSSGNIGFVQGETDRTSLNDAVYGALAKFERQCSEEGLFAHPFMVRYAYRLYDGSHVKPSSPVLMFASNTHKTAVEVHVPNPGTQGKQLIGCTAGSPAASLYYNIAFCPALSAWHDMIEGIDVFVSRPLRTYDASKEVTKFSTVDKADAPFGIYNNMHEFDAALPDAVSLSAEEFSLYRRNTLSSAYAQLESSDVQQLAETSQFYQVAFIPLSELSASPNANRLKLEPGALQSLETRETLEDDYLSLCEVTASGALTYNSRLLTYGVTRALFDGFRAAAAFAPCMSVRSGDNHVRVKIMKNGVEHIVGSDFQDGLSGYLGGGVQRYDAGGNGVGGRPLFYFFYPDPDATYAYVRVTGDVTYPTQQIELPLRRHPFLNGAYWFGGLGMGDAAKVKTGDAGALPAKKNGSVYGGGQLRVSEVNNPFVTPLSNVTTIGAGRVLRLAAATRPLSEGQFGEFPVMAFTTEGIWSVAIDSKGVPVSRQPISRAVLSNRRGLCNLDDAVAFVSHDGINILRGSVVTSITDKVNMPFEDVRAFFKDVGLDDVESEFGLSSPQGAEKLVTASQGHCLCSSSRFQRIYVLPVTDTSFGAVYDLKSGTWSTFDIGFGVTGIVDDYPTTLVQRGGGLDVYDLNTQAAGDTLFGSPWLLTRPMKLGPSDVPKTVHEAIVRGRFDDYVARTYGPGGITYSPHRDVGCILFGSNDLEHWFIVNSSVNSRLRGRVGTPYKYVRLMVICRGTFGRVDECGSSYNSLSGASFDVQARLNNTLR